MTTASRLSALTSEIYKVRISLPASLDLIHSKPGPFTVLAEEHALGWMQRYKLLEGVGRVQQFAAMQPGALAVHCFPSASSAQTLVLTEWMSWLFVIDDQNDEGPLGHMTDVLEEQLAVILESAFNGQELTSAIGPSGEALKAFWHRVREGMSVSWQRRFRLNVHNCLTAFSRQAAHRALDEPPFPETFLQLRRDSGAIWPSFDLIEWVEGYCLPPSLYLSRCYQTLLLAAADVVCWTNDLMTLRKEAALGDFHNYVLVLHQAHDMSLQQAVDQVVGKTEARIYDFLRAEKALPDTIFRLDITASDKMHVYSCVGMLRSWMRGHVDWGVRTGRYRSA